MQEPLSLHPLGATNVQIPSLCVGCAALGDMPGTFAYSVAEEQALATIRAIFEGSGTYPRYMSGGSIRLKINSNNCYRQQNFLHRTLCQQRKDLRCVRLALMLLVRYKRFLFLIHLCPDRQRHLFASGRLASAGLTTTPFTAISHSLRIQGFLVMNSVLK